MGSKTLQLMQEQLELLLSLSLSAPWVFKKEVILLKNQVLAMKFKVDFENLQNFIIRIDSIEQLILPAHNFPQEVIDLVKVLRAEASELLKATIS